MNFALRRWLRSTRIIKTIEYGPRWRFHYVRIGSAADLDEQLTDWLRESHDTVCLQDDLRPPR